MKKLSVNQMENLAGGVCEPWPGNAGDNAQFPCFNFQCALLTSLPAPPFEGLGCIL